MSSDKFLRAEIANWLIFGSAFVGLLYAAYAFWSIRKIQMDAETIKIQELTDQEKEEIANKH